jgi:ParB family transcriptional regulator, chromosome partitioning protein
MARRSGLGKGLGALIPEGAPEQAPEAEPAPSGPLRAVAVGRIHPNRFQPRQVFSPESLESLAASIKELGVLQPLIVRPVDGGEYELIAGERRLRAAALAGLETVPVLVQDDVNDRLSLEQAVVENLHRVDLHPLEEAAAYQQLIEEFDLTHEQVATRVGKSRATVTNTLRLLNLGEPAQVALANGTISAGHARALLGLADPKTQSLLVRKIVANDLSVRATEEAVRSTLEPRPLSGPEPKEVAIAPVAKLRPVPDASVAELERLLEDYLDTRVHVDLKGRNGKIVIDFADLDDLERIYLAISKKS